MTHSPAIARFSAAGFRARAARASAPADLAFGDHRWSGEAEPEVAPDSLRDAAVLVPVVDRGDAGATVLLTQRTATLRSHSGQIAFPGGRVDPDDASPEAAALREAKEEVGLDPDRVELVGRLPDYLTGSGYRIAPILGIVSPPFDLVLNPAEVDSVFETPLAFLMEPANHSRRSGIWKGRERSFYAMPWGERFIWGVTAGILRMLYERLYR